MKTITVYHFDDLDARTQGDVIETLRADADLWGWQDEWWQSAQAFCRIAPIEVTAADYDNARVDVRWAGDDDLRDLAGLRAWKWLQNQGWFDWARENSKGSCLLTGYCGDCPLSDPILTFERTVDPRMTLEDLFHDCAHAWVQEARRDLEYCYSDEHVREWIEANELTFHENGALV